MSRIVMPTIITTALQNMLNGSSLNFPKMSRPRIHLGGGPEVQVVLHSLVHDGHQRVVLERRDPPVVHGAHGRRVGVEALRHLLGLRRRRCRLPAGDLGAGRPQGNGRIRRHALRDRPATLPVPGRSAHRDAGGHGGGCREPRTELRPTANVQALQVQLDLTELRSLSGPSWWRRARVSGRCSSSTSPRRTAAEPVGSRGGPLPWFGRTIVPRWPWPAPVPMKEEVTVDTEHEGA